MQIVQYPSKTLLTPCIEVERCEIDSLSRILRSAYVDILCAGIAAPQVGIGKQIFIAQGTVYINPHLKTISDTFYYPSEGCLSLKGKYGKNYNPKRSNSIILQWIDEHGNNNIDEFSGYVAEVLQHEYEHLQGRLLIHHKKLSHNSLEYLKSRLLSMEPS